jgi:hypothetical protein
MCDKKERMMAAEIYLSFYGMNLVLPVSLKEYWW